MIERIELMKKTISLLLLLVMAAALLAACGASDSAASKANVYSFTCVDENGKGVEGVRLQICTEEQCRLYSTDKNGRVVCVDLPTAVYEVHVLMCPDGYSYDRNAVYTTSDTFESVTLTLQTVK